MIDGIWWLVILFAVITILWFVAKSRGAKVGENSGKKTKSTAPNDALQKTSALLKQHFSEYTVMRKTNHLLVSKDGQKVAMITIDKKIVEGQRRLGEVPVINYHRVPSRAQLTANLQDAE